ncbi:RmlC-like cupin domain-containing protein [Mrakia frigida]|uniref:Cff1p n=1 Tax=Mrakia frigida TaxID=29902 RepID=UPI003FCBF620
MSLYAYPEPNSLLHKNLKLEQHFEGGYFVQTEILSGEVPSPYAEGASRPMGTQIYYLLDPNSPWGRMHMNRSATFHVHHCGRSEYTLIYPPTGDSPARVEYHVMGANSELGEVKQLFAPSNVWKASRIPVADLAHAKEGGGDRERIGCLISEVVVPGWVMEDHAFLTKEKLLELFAGDEEKAKPFLEIVKPLAERSGP